MGEDGNALRFFEMIPTKSVPKHSVRSRVGFRGNPTVAYMSIPCATSPLITAAVAADRQSPTTGLSTFGSREPSAPERGGSSTGNVGGNRVLLEKAAVNVLRHVPLALLDSRSGRRLRRGDCAWRRRFQKVGGASRFRGLTSKFPPAHRESRARGGVPLGHVRLDHPAPRRPQHQQTWGSELTTKKNSKAVARVIGLFAMYTSSRTSKALIELPFRAILFYLGNISESPTERTPMTAKGSCIPVEERRGYVIEEKKQQTKQFLQTVSISVPRQQNRYK